MNRAELQRLAEARIQDAKALLKEKRWACAYYVAGYAVECALKACVLAYIERTGIIFEDRKYAERCWTHDLEELMKLAELSAKFGLETAANRPLRENWRIVTEWDEASRYRSTPHYKAKELYKAITEKVNGVMPWIRNRW